MDDKARRGINGLRIAMGKLHKRTIPVTRSDEYNPATMPEAKKKEPSERRYPWVVHFAGCITEQAPNDDAAKVPIYLEQPLFIIWVGSEQAKTWTEQYFHSRGFYDIKVIVKFSEYATAFRSESGMKKKAPP